MVTELYIEGDRRLRVGFSQLLRQKVKKQFLISMEGSETDAAKKFTKPANIKGKALLIDLDMVSEKRADKLKKLKLEKDKKQVYFMVQNMEAWFLSQPEVISKQFGLDVSKLIKQAPHEIAEPDKFLSDLVKSKREYHKVKDAVNMLLDLKLNLLESKFEDVKNLVTELSKA